MQLIASTTNMEKNRSVAVTHPIIDTVSGRLSYHGVLRISSRYRMRSSRISSLCYWMASRMAFFFSLINFRPFEDCYPEPDLPSGETLLFFLR
jgi:hypothetical protein